MQISPDNAEEQFTAAFDQYADAIFRHCQYRIFDRERGKELMQETFMKTWEYIAKGHEVDNVQAFLYRTANNLIIDDVRRRKKRIEVSLEDMQEAGFDIGDNTDAEAMQSRLDGEQVMTVLKQIEEPYRDVLVMRYVDQLSPKEIATLLGESANAVSVRINRGMKKLISLLRSDG